MTKIYTSNDLKNVRIHARDIIALVLILGCILLKLKGLDGNVSLVLAAIVGYYFSKRVYEETNKTPK